MLTYIDASGNLVKTVPEKIYQGSNLANTIYLVGAYPQASVITIAFKLPQTGHYTQPYVMLNANIPTEIGLNAWSFDVPVAITEYYGKIEFQVTVFGGTKTVIINGEPTAVPIQIKSAYGTFEVEKGVQVDTSDIQAPDVYDQILYLISQIQAQINNHELVAMGILPYSDSFEYPLNALTYYNGNLYRSLQAQNIDKPLDNTEWWEEWDLSDITDLLARVGALEETVGGFDGRITQAEADATEAKTKANSALTKVSRIKVEDNNDGTFTFTNGENQQTTIQSGYRPDNTTIQLDENDKLKAIAIKDGIGTITPSDVRGKLDNEVISTNYKADLTLTTDNFNVIFEDQVDPLNPNRDTFRVAKDGIQLTHNDEAVRPKVNTTEQMGYLSDAMANGEMINTMIPSQASSSNQLADKEFVNSSIASNTANFIGTFASVSELEAYSGTVTNNDYAFVINSVVTDNGDDWATFAGLNAYDKTLLTNFDYAWVVNGSNFDLYRFNIVEQEWVLRVENTAKNQVTLNTAYNRYKATVSGSTVTWAYEYTLNNSSFTAAQWAAINSGITSSLVTKLINLPSDAESNLVNDVQVDDTSIVSNKVAKLYTKTAYNASTNKLATESDLPNVSNFAQRKITAPDYDNTATYSVGDVVIYNQTLYKCATAVSTAEDFDSTKWTAIDVIEYVDSKGVTKEDIIRNLPPFKSTIQLSVSDTTTAYTFPIVSSTNFAVDWGDGTFEFFNTATTSLTHTFATSGTIYVQFYGNWNGIKYTSSSNTSKALLYQVFYDKNITSIPASAFYECNNLEHFEYATNNLIIGNQSFYVASNMLGGNGVKDFDFSRVSSIGQQAFRNCARLKYFTMVNGTLNNNAFQSSGLLEAKIRVAPKTAFQNCLNLYKIIIDRITTTIANNAFSGSPIHIIISNSTTPHTLSGSLGTSLPSDLVILVPYSELNSYKTATNWSSYANQIYPIGGQYSETVSITSGSWTLNSQTNLYEATVTVVGATNESRNVIEYSLVDSNGNQIEDTYGLGAKTQASRSITFTAQTVPTSAINIFVKSTLTNYQE